MKRTKEEIEKELEERQEALIECLSVIHECPMPIELDSCIFRDIRRLPNRKDREEALKELAESELIIDYCNQHLECWAQREEESFN